MAAPGRREELIWLAALNLVLPVLASLLSGQVADSGTRNMLVLLTAAIVAGGNLWRMFRNRRAGFRATYGLLIVLNLATTLIFGGTGIVLLFVLVLSIAFTL